LYIKELSVEKLRESCSNTVEIAWKTDFGLSKPSAEANETLVLMKTRSIDRRGQLIVFEGVDGVGKTTLSRRLVLALRRDGIGCDRASFPGREPGTLAAHIYRLYHSPSHFGVRFVDDTALQLLVTAAHVETIQSLILPSLNAGKTVVLDRFWWSTWVYGRASGVSPRMLEQLIAVEELAWSGVVPTKIFLVTRPRPDGQKSTRQTSQLSSLYHSLARREASRGRYPVSVLANDGSLQDAVSAVRSRLR
jgi:dTMP kinase